MNFNNLKSWPFEEAKRLNQRNILKVKDVCIFQTGYGPSGLPHIGTFAEVLRTSMVIKAFKKISNKKTNLIVFSDDMDGLRKIPENFWIGLNSFIILSRQQICIKVVFLIKA